MIRQVYYCPYEAPIGACGHDLEHLGTLSVPILFPKSGVG